MTPIIIALAGLGGGSTEDELWFDAAIFVVLLLQAMLFPISTFDHPPQWMVWLQPPLVICGLIAVHFWLRTWKPGRLKRVFFYGGSYCLLMFATNMAGEARGLFFVAGDIVDKARLLSEGKGWDRDTRP